MAALPVWTDGDGSEQADEWLWWVYLHAPSIPRTSIPTSKNGEREQLHRTLGGVLTPPPPPQQPPLPPKPPPPSHALTSIPAGECREIEQLRVALRRGATGGEGGQAGPQLNSHVPAGEVTWVGW